ncbi:MAG: hypothetical protein QNK35_18645 [Bacteroides sp.]|nr:hypothetical protein [Bacteroides sp.]
MIKKNFLRVLISLLIFVGLDLLSGLFLIPDSFNSFRTKHYYFHHGLMPGQKTMAAWGALIYPMHTNSLGMVDSTNQRVNKESLKHRILFLGDSHSEGVGVPYPLTFAGRLASELHPQGIEILNASAVSYSQKTEYLKARYLIEIKGLKVDEIMVLVDISDIQNELVYENFEAKEKSALGDLLFRIKIRLTKSSTLYYLVDAIQTQKQQDRFFKSTESFNKNAETNQNNNIWELYASFFSDFSDEVLLSNPQFHGMGGWMEDENFRELALKGIGMGQAYILKLQELCKQNDIKLTISVHPWHHQIERGEELDDYARNWKSFALDHEIPFISFYPLFINEEDPDTVIRKYYIKNDNHWNEFGHERVANYLKDYFVPQSK